MRKEVKTFAAAMEQQLVANDHKSGWQQDTPEDLLLRLLEESAEVSTELRLNRGSWTDIDRAALVKECADVANFAMMIADVCGGLKENSDA